MRREGECMKRIILVDLGERELKKRNALRATSTTKTPLKSVAPSGTKKKTPGKTRSKDVPARKPGT
jgi:hypothetical protein